MDSITQALLGATVAEAGFRGRLGGKAVAFGAVCGVLPDLDVVARVGGEWASLVHHRGVTHSLLVLPLAAPIVGWVGSRLVGQGRDLWTWAHLAFWALVTHPLLDVFTTYGTQLFAPFSDTRYALDGVAIIDPIYTMPLLVAVILARRRDRALSRRVAAVALAFTTAYLGFGWAVSQGARSSARAQLMEEGFDVVALRTPVPIAFPLLRRIVARDAEGGIRIGAWSPLRDRIDLVELPRATDPRVTRALSSEEGRVFRWFADGFLHAVVREDGEGAVVELIDQRYGFYVEPAASPFRVQFRFAGSGEVLGVERMQRPSNVDFGQEMSAGWRLMTGG